MSVGTADDAAAVAEVDGAAAVGARARVLLWRLPLLRPAPPQSAQTLRASCCTFCASVDVTYSDGGVEDTFAPELVRTDQVAIVEDGARVIVGETVIHFADDAYTPPGEARKLAEALTELADWAEGLR
jgi:hypothetical protein